MGAIGICSIPTSNLEVIKVLGKDRMEKCDYTRDYYGKGKVI